MKTQYAVAIATLAIAIGGVAVQALHAQAKPRAYVVIEIDVVNQDAFFKEFVPVAVKTITDQGGKFLARGGKLVNIEGPAPLASEDKRLTVVEFERQIFRQGELGGSELRVWRSYLAAFGQKVDRWILERPG